MRTIHLYLMAALAVSALLLFSVPALATSLPQPAADPSLFELLSLLVGGEAAAKWVTLIGFGAWVLTQIMAWLPPEWVAKCPTLVIRLLKVLSGNYRKAANEVVNDPEQIRRAT